MSGEHIDKNWDRIVTYYNQYYANIIERLFKENGWEVISEGTDAAKEETTEPQ